MLEMSHIDCKSSACIYMEKYQFLSYWISKGQCELPFCTFNLENSLLYKKDKIHFINDWKIKKNNSSLKLEVMEIKLWT